MIYTYKFLLVMLAMTLADICWAFYFIKVSERKATQAGVWAVLLFFTGAIVTSNYVDDHSLMVAAALGAFIGTAITVQYKKNREEKKVEKVS